MYEEIYNAQFLQPYSLSIRAKMISGERPLLRENLTDRDHPLAKRRFSIYFRSYSASSVTRSKTLKLTLIGSPLYALSNKPKMNIVRCP